MIHVVCLDCRRYREHLARGLCPACYQHRSAAKTLDERPPLSVREGGGLADSPLQFGITYRQLDWWVRQGYLKPENPRPGSGSWRTWPEDELEIARVMSLLVVGGVKPDAAARVARGGDLAPGIQLVVAPPHDPAALMEEPDLYADEKPERGVGWRLARDEEIQDAAHMAAMEERHQHEADEQPEGSDR